jgi:hypothetical protein
MKFKLKVLLAAMALAAAGQASATIALPDSTNGELFFDVTDAVAGISFTGDLGAPTSVSNSAYNPTDPTYSDFTVAATSNPGATYVWDLTSFGTTWNTFKTAAGTGTNAVFDVLGGFRTSTSTAGGQGLLTTSAAAITSFSNGGVTTALTKLDTTFLSGATGVNSLAGMTGANGSITAVAADGFAYTGTSKGDNLFGTSLVTVGAVGAGNALNFYQLVTSSTSSLGQSTKTAFAGSWTLDYAANTLTYAVAPAVPEADTWAMMLAGLMVVGGITRRRMSA